MMSEAIDETLDKDEAEEETEELTNQVSSMTALDYLILEFLSECPASDVYLLYRCLMRSVLTLPLRLVLFYFIIRRI